MSLVTLKTFGNHVDAHLTKSILESEGVRCYLFDEYMMTLNPIYNLSLDGIKLKITEAEVGKALEVLRKMEAEPYIDEKGEVLHCPVANLIISLAALFL